MKRILPIVLTLWIVCDLLVIGSISVGRSRSAPESFATPQIGLCNNVPCVQDVVPGVTAWDDVTARFASVVDSTSTSGSLTLGTNGLIQTTFAADSRNDKVDSIDVVFAVPYVTLAALATQFGVPCKVRVYASGGVQLIYPQLTANLDVSQGPLPADMRFPANMQISELDFLSEQNTCDLQTADPANLFQDEPWHGFGVLDTVQN